MNLWTKFLNWCKARKYRNCDYGHWTAENFARLRYALDQCVDAYLEDRLRIPHGGICFNAGFMSYFNSGDFQNECRLFLMMCQFYNEAVRGLKVRPFANPFPFNDVDCYTDRRWIGAPAEVRTHAMLWIINEIDRLNLDDSKTVTMDSDFAH